MNPADNYLTERIPLDKLIDCPLNKRHVDASSADLISLGASLEHRQEQDLIVRPVDGGKFEVLDGKRRVAAARLHSAIPSLWCQVRPDCTDSEAKQIILVTQLHRQNLTPLEEAVMVADLLSEGLTHADVAAQLGQTAPWVAKRAKLVDLAQPWRDGMDAGTYPWLTVGHLEVIARLPDSVQREMATDYAQAWRAPASLGDFDLEIRERYLHGLKHAPWKLDDLALLPAAGACTVCPKRSSCETYLFADTTGDADRCLDAVCWADKLTAHTASKARQLAEKNPGRKVLLLRDAAADHPMPAPTRLPEQVVVVEQSHGLEECRKADAGSMPALNIDTGKQIWMRPTAHIPATLRTALGLPAPAKTAGSTCDTAPTPTPAQRRAAQRLAVRMRILDDEITDADPPSAQEILALYATFVVGHFDPLTDNGWAEYQANMGKPAEEIAHLLWQDFLRRLPLTRKVTARDVPDAAAIAKLERLATLDPAEQEAKALVEIPEPKRKG